MSNEEIWRFQKMEKLLESKISRHFKVRRLNKDDFGYLIEHLYGQTKEPPTKIMSIIFRRNGFRRKRW